MTWFSDVQQADQIGRDTGASGPGVFQHQHGGSSDEAQMGEHAEVLLPGKALKKIFFKCNFIRKYTISSKHYLLSSSAFCTSVLFQSRYSDVLVCFLCRSYRRWRNSALRCCATFWPDTVSTCPASDKLSHTSVAASVLSHTCRLQTHMMKPMSKVCHFQGQRQIEQTVQRVDMDRDIETLQTENHILADDNKTEFLMVDYFVSVGWIFYSVKAGEGCGYRLPYVRHTDKFKPANLQYVLAMG